MRFHKLKFGIAASPFPLLIDVTTESLETGLESGLFTSVDLVHVRFRASGVVKRLSRMV